MRRAQDLTVAEGSGWLQEADAPTVLDVRTPVEFAGHHIAGAVNAPLDVISQHADEIAEHLHGEVLFVCRTDGRAHEAARMMAGSLGGRGHVLNGGMTAWREAGLPVRGPGQGVWSVERQVRATAGGIVLASVFASIVAPRSRFVAGGVGAGLVFAGVTDTCGMAKLLQKMPWNRGLSQPSVSKITSELDRAN